MLIPRFSRMLTIACVIAFVIIGTIGAVAEERAIKDKVSPTYPEIAKRMNVFGTVKVMVTIAPSGGVTATKVLGGHPLLADAAVNAIKKWKYEAASSETTQLVEINFTR